MDVDDDGVPGDGERFPALFEGESDADPLPGFYGFGGFCDGEVEVGGGVACDSG